MSVGTVWTDLISIGDDTILRKESMILGYRAHSAISIPGWLAIGRNAFVGVGSTLDIHTKIGDRAQLGHSSSLQWGQSIPDGERWHGSPAVPTTANYWELTNVACRRCGTSFSTRFQPIILFMIVTPLPLLFHSYWVMLAMIIKNNRHCRDRHPVTLFGYIAAALFGATVLPRLFRFFFEPVCTYPLYGIDDWLNTMVELRQQFPCPQPDIWHSSAIVHYIRAIGWDLNEVVQTGSILEAINSTTTPSYARSAATPWCRTDCS